MSKDKNDIDRQVQFLGQQVDLKELEKSGFRFIGVNDTKKSSSTLTNLYYPTNRRTGKK